MTRIRTHSAGSSQPDGSRPKRVRKGCWSKRILNRSAIQEQLTAYLNIPNTYDKKLGYHAKAREILNVILDTMTKTLQRGEQIEIKGFGIFKIRELKAREIKNVIVEGKFQGIRTPKVTKVPARKYVYFQPSRILKALVNMDNPEKTYDEKRILSRDISTL